MIAKVGGWKLMTDKITEIIVRGKNYTLSLPFIEEVSDNGKHFTTYYNRMCECAKAFAETENARIRSYRSRYTVTEENGEVYVTVTITARIKEHGKIPEHRTKVISDVWREGKLISHTCTEKL